MSDDRSGSRGRGDRTAHALRRLRRRVRGALSRASDDPFADALALLTVVAAGAWVYYRRLGGYGLQTWDEGNYAVVARFVLDGHVLFLRHYSFADGVHAATYLEKPPLALWIEALSMAIVGETPLGARLPSATFAIGIGVLAYLWGRRWAGRRTGALAAVVFLTIPHVYAGNDMGRTGGVDTAFVFFGTLFVLLGWRLVAAPRRRGPANGGGGATDVTDGAGDATDASARVDASDGATPSVRRFLPFYLAGIATVLTKGFAAATFLFVLAPLLVAHARTFLRRESIVAAAAASAIGAAWPLAAYLVAGDRFVRELVVEQVLSRISGETGISYPGATFEFMRYPYFERLPTFLDPWGYFLFPAAAALTAVAAYRWGSARAGTEGGRGAGRESAPAATAAAAPVRELETTLLLVWWAALVPVLFAVTRGNHPWYLLPMYVPVALLVGRTLADASRGRSAAALAALVGVWAFLAYSFRIPAWSPIAIREAGGLHGTVPTGETVLLAVLLGVAALLAVGVAELLGVFGVGGRDGDDEDPERAADERGGGGDREWGRGARAVAVAGLLLFVGATTAAPALDGRGWDVAQRGMAIAVDDAAPPDATVYMTPEATEDGVYHAFAFHVDRSLETATVAELNRGGGVDYAVVAERQADGLSRPHERLDSATTPGGTGVVLVRIGG